jgi:hypothetical protein
MGGGAVGGGQQGGPPDPPGLLNIRLTPAGRSREVTTQTLLGLIEAVEAEEAIKNPKDVLKNTIVN